MGGFFFFGGCDAGCIACGICVRNCPMGAISIENNHAVIDEEKCIACGMWLNSGMSLGFRGVIKETITGSLRSGKRRCDHEETYTFTVTVLRTTDQDKPLLRYLRGLTWQSPFGERRMQRGRLRERVLSFVDGRAVKSCVLTTKRAVGKNIITTEGLSDEEKEAFVYAFGSKGSVQCGFCSRVW